MDNTPDNFRNSFLTTLLIAGVAGLAALFPLLWFWLAHGLIGVDEYTSVWVISFLYCLGAMVKAMERTKKSG
jgi:hypothetical protein